MDNKQLRKERMVEYATMAIGLMESLSGNEIDSDYFAVTSSNENGQETESEYAITATAASVAVLIKQLLAALEEKDERSAFESFIAQQFGETVDRRRAKNGDNEYMAWDMAMAWTVWQRRAATFQLSGNSEPVSQRYKLNAELLNYIKAQILRADNTGCSSVNLNVEDMKSLLLVDHFVEDDDKVRNG
jgi:hypothetical protein